MKADVPAHLIEAGRGYEALFVPALFDAWTRHVVEAAGIREGADVVDIACGTGVLTRSAKKWSGARGRVVGVDSAPGMIATACEIEPSIEWLLCSAESLNLEDESFDCVVSQFGMMFFDDRQKSVDEMCRVLRPGGSVAIAVWRSVEHNPAYADIIFMMQEHVGTAAADALRLPFSLGKAEDVVSVLKGSGLVEIKVEAKTESASFPGSRQMVEAELRGWLPLFDIVLDEDEIENILVESDKILRKYVNSSGKAVFPVSAHIHTAKKPPAPFAVCGRPEA